MPIPPPVIIGVGGFQSNTGKTTLVCELLRLFPDWEAIKTTRGHYRSCGKDPHSCCVSHLLSNEAIVRSGREATYSPGKDTGRYWDAGASNVHWVIATEEQIGKGIHEALRRVQSPGVFIEGNSFSEFIDVNAMFMVAPVRGGKIKKSAKLALPRAACLILTNEDSSLVADEDREAFRSWLVSTRLLAAAELPELYSLQDVSQLAARVQRLGPLVFA